MKSLRLILIALAASTGIIARVAEAESLFLPAELLAVDPRPSMVALGDITGDHRDDAVLGSSGCNMPTTCRLFLLPQESGALTGPIGYPIWPPRDLAIGDLNGDGRGDVVVTNGGEIEIYFQDSSGTLLPPIAAQPTYDISELALGDLNGDGRTDIASIPSGGYNVDLFLQTATGALDHQSIELMGGHGHQNLIVEDLDGDGFDDLLLFAGGRVHLTFLYQQPSGGGFTEPASFDFGRAFNYVAAAVGNFDADPRPELAVAGLESGLAKPFKLQIIDQTAPRAWRWGRLVAAGDVSSIAVADLDGNGRDDLVALNRALSVDVWTQGKPGTFSLEGRYSIPFGNYLDSAGLALGDLNDDRLLDVAVASDNYGLVLLMQRNSTPAPPSGEWLIAPGLPGFEFQARLTAGESSIAGVLEADCIEETGCVSGALAGRSEVFLRVVGPKPNGRLWPTLVKFSTSTVEIWLRQVSTGELKYYRLEGASPGKDELPGLFDRTGFQPDLAGVSADASSYGETLAETAVPEAPEAEFTSERFPDFRFRARITAGSQAQEVRKEMECIEETLCLSGAIPGRSEVFVRIVGPKPNGRLWPTIVKFTTSMVEVWIEQVSTGETKYYRIEGAAPGKDELTGLFDRTGFAP